MHCIFTFCVSARFLQPSEEFEHLTFLSTRVAKAQAVLASPARPAITIANAHPRFLSAIACGISCLKQTWPKSPVTSAILYWINPLPIHVIKLRCQKNWNCPCDVKSLSAAMTMASKSGSFRMPKVASVYTLFARPCAANLSVRVTWNDTKTSSDENKRLKWQFFGGLKKPSSIYCMHYYLIHQPSDGNKDSSKFTIHWHWYN